MAASSKWCTTCRANFRGLWGVHATTQRHRRMSRPKSFGRIKVRARESWMHRGPQGDDMEKVHDYQRRRPLNGPRKVVKVAGYWRHERYIATRIYKPKKHRKRS